MTFSLAPVVITYKKGMAMITATVVAASGASSTFWIPSEVIFRPILHRIDIEICGFLTQADFAAGRTALEKKQYVIPPAEYDAILAASTSSGIAVAIQNWIVANDPLFNGGIVS